MKDLATGFNPGDGGMPLIDVPSAKTLTLQQNQNIAGQCIGNSNNTFTCNSTDTSLINEESLSKYTTDPLAIEEKFRVDRKKLESMLKGENDAIETAESFFQRVMDETKATIIWPSKLKIGAKSKKDPHVKIIGRPHQVKPAKEKIMALLDVKTNRVCLKIDVAYTDHSHLIGKQGRNIQEIMHETKTKIHFPDSNRNNNTDKSNQVSINGQPNEVKKALEMIRQNLPLTIKCEYPPYEHLYSSPDSSDFTTFVDDVKKRYNVVVNVVKSTALRPYGLKSSEFSVRGSEKFSQNVIIGTKILLQHLFGTASDEVKVSIVMDIAAHHHEVVRAQCIASKIEAKWNVKILFPEANPRAPSIERSPVTIAGNVDVVNLARKQILSFLPVSMSFDLPEDYAICRELATVKSKHHEGLEITAKAKQRDGKMTIMIKGIEQQVPKMLNVREIYIKDGEMTDSSTSSNFSSCSSSFSSDMSLSVRSDSSIGLQLNNYCLAMPSNERKISSGGWSTSSTSSGIPSSVGSNMFDSSFYKRMNQLTNLQISDMGIYSGPSSTTSSLSSPAQSPRFGTPIDFSFSNLLLEKKTNSCRESVSLNQVVHGLEQIKVEDNISLPLLKTNFDALSLDSTLVCKDNLNETTDSDTDTIKNFMYNELPEMRLLAYQASKKPVKKPETRIPTDRWRGGFSVSLPSAQAYNSLRDNFEENGSPSTENFPQDAESWPTSSTSFSTNCSRSTLATMNDRPRMNLSSSNHFDTDNVFKDGAALLKCKTVDEILLLLDLIKYLKNFQEQEIDLPTFLTLTDADLKNLGIDKFGPKRKLLMAIACLKTKPCVRSPAPGYERKFGVW